MSELWRSKYLTRPGIIGQKRNDKPQGKSDAVNEGSKETESETGKESSEPSKSSAE